MRLHADQLVALLFQILDHLAAQPAQSALPLPAPATTATPSTCGPVPRRAELMTYRLFPGVLLDRCHAGRAPALLAFAALARIVIPPASLGSSRRAAGRAPLVRKMPGFRRLRKPGLSLGRHTAFFHSRAREHSGTAQRTALSSPGPRVLLLRNQL